MGDALMAKVGAWIGALLPAAIGSALSLMFNKQEEPVSRLMLFCIFFAGIALGHYVGNFTIEVTHVDQKSFTATCIIMTWGLFGLAIFQEISNRLPGAIRAVFDQIPETLKVLRKKFLGE